MGYFCDSTALTCSFPPFSLPPFTWDRRHQAVRPLQYMFLIWNENDFDFFVSKLIVRFKINFVKRNKKSILKKTSNIKELFFRFNGTHVCRRLWMILYWMFFFKLFFCFVWQNQFGNEKSISERKIKVISSSSR